MPNETKLTRSQKVATDISTLIRARNPVLWIKSGEEVRVEGYLAEAAASAGYEIRFWDVGGGVTKLDGKAENASLTDIVAVLDAIQGRAENGVPGKKESRTVWVLRDPAIWLEGFPGAAPLRKLRNLARSLPASDRAKAQTIIVLSAKGEIPAELAGHTTVIDWPMPDRAEIGSILDAAVSILKDEDRAKAFGDSDRDAAIDAAVGLTGEEASSCYAKSLVQSKRIDPAIIAAEKKSVIAREKVLEWVEPIPGGLDAVGGLDVLKGWLDKRKLAYSPRAKAYGLPAPKGVFVYGISGCGKSLLAKSAPVALGGVPLLKMDLGALKGKFVGESEANIRKALKTIEAIGRCVVWIDEIEKAMQGATSGSADGGVSADALGTLLTWMQERTSEAFVIATANDPSALPPELMRKGRWDEVFFVDLPTFEERKQVAAAALKANGRKDAPIDLDEVAEVTADFTGAEIAALIPEALFHAFADDEREITTEDIIEVARPIVPLAKTAEEKITALRTKAKGNARRATSEEVINATKAKGRQLDFA